jgi:ABC-type polar amino acid transport system ATPase subunit
MLELKDITKIFGDKRVINNVSFSVKRGEIAMLVGPSGVGKSTLLRVLNNLEPLDRGTVLFNGELLDLTKINQTHTIGMVFQGFNLFEHLTVEENITLPLQKVLGRSIIEAQKIADHLLQHYGLLEKKNEYPASLSGGQKQRLAIARSLALKPKIICLDEPTSALDPLLTTHVANNIQELAQEGYTVLVASHDTQLIRSLDCTIYLMDSGSIIETATSSQLKNNPQQFPRLSAFLSGIIA